MERVNVEMDGVFFDLVRNALNLTDDAALEGASVLAELDGWDSLGKFMFLSSVASDYDVMLDVPGVNAAKTVGDLWNLVQKANDDDAAQQGSY